MFIPNFCPSVQNDIFGIHLPPLSWRGSGNLAAGDVVAFAADFAGSAFSNPTATPGIVNGNANHVFGNVTTMKYVPKPDYKISKTLYDEIDELESRIALLTKAAKVVGVFDRSSKDLVRVLTEGVENQMMRLRQPGFTPTMPLATSDAK